MAHLFTSLKTKKVARKRQSWECWIDYIIAAYILERFDPLLKARKRGPDGKTTSYCHIETSCEADCDDPEEKTLSAILHEDVLACEIDAAGIPETWSGIVASLKDGYYKVRFNYQMTTDGDEDGGGCYPVLDQSLPEFTPSIVSNVLSKWSWTKDQIYAGTLLFRKTWAIRFEYPTKRSVETGVWECGGGTYTKKMWLPAALWSLTGGKRAAIANAWGGDPRLKLTAR
jgi:hypothetical protein